MKSNQLKRVQSCTAGEKKGFYESVGTMNTLIVQEKRDLKSKIRQYLDKHNVMTCPRFAHPRKTINMNALKKFEDFNYILLKLRKSPKFMGMIKAPPKQPTVLTSDEAHIILSFLTSCSSRQVELVS